jgi:hypothetical protein
MAIKWLGSGVTVGEDFEHRALGHQLRERERRVPRY